MVQPILALLTHFTAYLWSAKAVVGCMLIVTSGGSWTSLTNVVLQSESGLRLFKPLSLFAHISHLYLLFVKGLNEEEWKSNFKNADKRS